MKNNVHSGHRTRLRETMLKNDMNNMQPHQVLEYLLSFVVAQRDTNPTAHNLINKFGSIDGVFEAPIEELEQVEGVGKVTATFLHSFLSFYDYYSNHKVKKITSITNTITAVIFANSILKNKLKEELYAILLDAQGFVLDYRKMSDGTKSSVSVKIRDITKYALSHNATQVIVCHNHPDTDSTPSAEDELFTENLRNALTPNGISMNEHVIVGNSDSYSFNSGYKIDENMIKEYLKDMGGAKWKTLPKMMRALCVHIVAKW